MGKDFWKAFDQGWKDAEEDRRAEAVQKGRNESWAKAQANDEGRPVTLSGFILLVIIVVIVVAVLSSGTK